MKCTFFGHRNTPQYVEKLLQETIIGLIENNNVDMFYVGNQGGFDCMVRKILEKLELRYPQVSYFVVLAYLPISNNNEDSDKYVDTIYPEGLEKIPRKFAIAKRNIWMIEQSDIVITFVKNSVGGACKFKNYAEKQCKIIINLAEKIPPTQIL